VSELFPSPEPPVVATTLAVYASVVPEVPVPGIFSYRVPEPLRERCRPGVRVEVPFGKGRTVRGFVLEVGTECPVDEKKVRDLVNVLGEVVVAEDVLALARWAAIYYRASLGDVLAAAIPQEATKQRARPAPQDEWLAPTPRDDPTRPPPRLGPVAQRLLEALADGARPLAQALELAGATRAQAKRLLEAGLATLEVREAAPAPPAPLPAVELPTLTPDQELVLRPLLKQLEPGTDAGSAGPPPTLLFGVTGSGKTEVYLRMIARVLELGLGAIVLVPEIALTPQTTARFRARFGDRVAVLHSQLGHAARRREWRRIQTGEAPVVVGPRSAVWAPVPKLGLVVVDEEHETTYKQESAPRYHARDLAVVRGKLAKAPVLLGTATPSLESWHNAISGRYRLARLRSRPAGASLPTIHVVDMGREWAEVKGAPLLSRVLVRELEATLGRGERAILFQNRRGFTTFLECPRCRTVLKCRQCDVTLTFHRALGAPGGATICHFCDERGPPPGGPCPACDGPPLKQRGAGTERIEDVIKERFPTARVGRLDTDVVREQEPAEVVLERFREGALDVLVGTQMIAKGLDIPEVTLVGVVAADTGLAHPDVRSAERAFQLVAQVAGRAGRGSRPGTTIVQTFLPDHVAIAAAATHDFERFARVELENRRQLDYPPFRRLLKLLVRGPQEVKVRDEAARVVDALRAANLEGVSAVLGPAPSPRAYLAGKFRWQALVKATAEGVRRAIALVEAAPPKGVEWHVDVDPYHLL
jgi:primosomal protein N' (replication factor Y)